MLDKGEVPDCVWEKEGKEKKVIRVCLKGEEVYRGTMMDLPLEEIILSKGVSFYDPNLLHPPQRSAGLNSLPGGGSRGTWALLELLYRPSGSDFMNIFETVC